VKRVTWLLITGAACGVWATLNVLCAERQRRVQAADLEAGARRQAALREAERLAALARKQPPAQATSAPAPVPAPAPAPTMKPAN
jgi:hypothetical protein